MGTLLQVSSGMKEAGARSAAAAPELFGRRLTVHVSHVDDLFFKEKIAKVQILLPHVNKLEDTSPLEIVKSLSINH